jgi:hypothetical protein
MKTNTLFAVLTESPCPECGGPRVGLDYDDDYAIVPGRSKPMPKCEAAPIRVETRQQGCDIAEAPCACGRERYVARPARHWEVHCDRHRIQHVQHLPGCSRCHEYYGL